MKRLCVMLIALFLLLLCCGCSKTVVNSRGDVTLHFVYQDKNVTVTLEAEEAARVTEILNGNRYDPLLGGVPSCGFTENVSLTVENRGFAIACDTCNCIQDLGNLRYFTISAENMAYIHGLFEKYGGYFPCV